MAARGVTVPDDATTLPVGPDGTPVADHGGLPSHEGFTAAERLEATVIGAVQGVGFRWFVMQVAGGLGLRGWVANRADGAVVCVAEGSRASLEALLTELARGPIAAQVDRVIPAWMPPTGRFERFQIRSGSHPGD